jgi:hypothetical protein
MFEYFPGNYVWNLGVVATINSGGLIDEVDRACRPIREAATRGEDAGTEQFLAAWTSVADGLVKAAEAQEKRGHRANAGAMLARATNYLVQAERMQARCPRFSSASAASTRPSACRPPAPPSASPPTGAAWT